jgi:hypothetical protein
MQRVEASGAATYRRGAITAAVMLASILPLAAANAQTSPTGTDDADEDATIIVQGERELEIDELRDAVRDVAMRGRDYQTPLEQYQTPLCPKVVGLGERMGAYVSDRIRSNAVAVGVEVADADCEANALVIVNDDPRLLIKKIQKSHPRLFSLANNNRIKQAQSRGDAAIVWSLDMEQGPRGRDGGATDVVLGTSLDGAFANAGRAPSERRLTRASRFDIPFSTERTFSWVVFDVDRLNGVHLDQLSDFATMRILGSPQPTIDIEQEGAVSILNLFDAGPAAAPMRMTALDMAYLKGLYAMGPNEPSTRLEAFVRVAYEDVVEQDCLSDCIGADPAPPP